MRINAVLLVWSIFLHANVVLCGKMMGFRQNAEALVLEKPRHVRVLVLKLKADAFVKVNITYAEVGSVKVVNANGTCLSCDSQAVCSSPVEFLQGSVQEACHGKKWSWKVSASSAFDIMIQIPLSKLSGRADFGVEVTSAVDSSGQNSAEQQGRQVRNWVVTSVMGTQDTSTGKWIRSAWSKVAVNLNGDFRSMVKSVEGEILTRDGIFSKELFAEHCLRPENITNYIVTELSLTKGEMDVAVKCKSAFRGKPKVTECEEDLTPYKLSGCALEFCSSPPASDVYAMKENSLARSVFDVEVSCKEPYSGEPEATVCSGDGEPYEVSGCEITTTTVTTTSTTTSTTTTTETSTSTSTTETSTTTTTSTSTTTETTTTTSTTETVTSTTTTTSTTTSTSTTTTTTTVVVCSEVEDLGYKVTVTSLEVPTFQVQASCGRGYEGDAKVEACEGVDQPIKLSGCKAIMCQTPFDTSGYVLTESSRGYALTEQDLSLKGFDVQVACAEGYTGIPKIQKCSKHTESYELEGCKSTTTTTTTTTETETSTTTSTVTETTTRTTTTTETVTTTTTITETSTVTITETSTTTLTSTTTETSTITVTSTQTTTKTSTSTSTSTSTTTTTSTVTVTDTQTSTTTTTSTSTVTSTSTTTSTITETETSTTTSTTSITETSTSTMTTTSTLTGTTTTTSTTTLTSTTTTSTSTSTSTTTSTTTTITSTTTTSTATSTTTTSTSTVTSTTTTTTSTITSTTTTVTSTTTLTTTTTTTTATSTTTTSTSTTSTSTTSTSTVTTTSTTATSTVTTTTSTTTTKLKAFCLAPDITTGYIVSEINLFLDHFDVSVKCHSGFVGQAVATPCNKHQGEYSLSGCKPESICVAPAAAPGYVVSERKLQISSFDVAVSCAKGFVTYSKPKATACQSDKQAYSLQGCGKVMRCLGADDATGYIVNEQNLLAHEFQVTARCAAGFVGTASVTRCNSDFGHYKLDGCRKER